MQRWRFVACLALGLSAGWAGWFTGGQAAESSEGTLAPATAAELRLKQNTIEHDLQAVKELQRQAIDATKESVQKDLSRLQTQIDNLTTRIGDIHNRVADLSLPLGAIPIVLTLLG